MKIHYTQWSRNCTLFTITLILFSFQNKNLAQPNCPPFHITYPSDACVAFDIEDIQSGLDIYKYRTSNGTFNNLTDYEKGRSGSDIRRKKNQAFYDGDGSSLINRGNPRMISNLIVNQPESIPDPNGLSSLVFTFLQFIDHDITGVEGSALDIANIPVPAGDSFFDPFNTGNQVISFHRTATADGTGTGVNNPRQHHNQLTAWIDASMVYGSDFARATWLRSGECGKLKSSSSIHGDLLPYNTVTGEFVGAIDLDAPFMDGDRTHSGDRKRVFVAGDIRANEQVGLTSMHTLFMREHNRICEKLIADGNCDDEHNYQYARKIVNGLIQSILYNELLPNLGIDLPNYSYSPNKSPNIFHSFATAAFRLGHTMVTEEVLLVDADCEAPKNGPSSLPLNQAFFNPTLVTQYGPSVFLRGLLTQTQEKLDAKVIGNLRNFLFGAPGSGGLDLASLNIQRGRDHGIPDFNSARGLFGLNPVYFFSEITADEAAQSALETAYGNVDNIDLWVGLLSEDPLPGKMAGPTLNKILKNQFRNIRDADRFFYLNDPVLNNSEKWEIQKATLADILKRNTDIQFAENVFFSTDCDSTVPDETYCAASGENTNYEWIQFVKIGDKKVTSGNNHGYADLTNQVFRIETNTPNFIKMRSGYSGIPYREHWRVWLDLNRDGDFEDPGETVFYGFKKRTVIGVIWLDETISSGYTQMRVAMSYGAAPTDCGTFEYGEIENYTVLIEQGHSNYMMSGTDFDKNLSPIAPINNFKVFPNPATEETTIAFETDKGGSVQITVNNTFGQIIETINTEVRIGENMFDLNIQNLKNGIYWVHLKLDGKRAKTVKLVVTN